MGEVLEGQVGRALSEKGMLLDENRGQTTVLRFLVEE
jgi:hypothetical protein